MSYTCKYCISRKILQKIIETQIRDAVRLVYRIPQERIYYERQTAARRPRGRGSDSYTCYHVCGMRIFGGCTMRKALLATKNGVEFVAIRTPQGKTLRYEIYWDGQFISSSKNGAYLREIFEDLTQD